VEEDIKITNYGIKENVIMNKIIILFTILFAVSLNLYGQIETKFEPQVLVLAPNQIKYDKVFEKELLKANKSIKKGLTLNEQAKTLTSKEYEKLAENLKIITKSELEFSKDINFFKQVSTISEQFLLYYLSLLND